MVKLLIGMFLWWAGHMFKRLAPALRRDMSTALGDLPAKGIFGLVLLVATWLIVSGYRQAGTTPLYTPVAGAGWLTDLLMLVAILVFGAGHAGGQLAARIRHPMLWGTAIWAFAHLLVNGDIASIILFGGLGVWALAEMRLINQSEGPWERPMPGDRTRDMKLALATLFIYFVIAGIHWLSGINPFQGTYT